MATTTKTKDKASKGKKKAVKAKAKVMRPDDGCRAIARAIADTKNPMSSSQVRILRALRKQKSPIDRGTLKELVGIGREGLYSAEWLNGLRELANTRPACIVIDQETEGLHGGYLHSITKTGIARLDQAEKAAKSAK